jgi:hypothetical protein
MTEALSSAFSTYINTIDNETNLLRSISNIRNQLLGPNSNDVTTKLVDIEAILYRLEKSIDEVEENIDGELQHINQTKELLNLSKEQANIIKDLSDTIDRSNIDNVKTNTVNPTKEEFLISLVDFEQVSKTTRSRLTFEQVNDSLKYLLKFVDIKTKVCQSYKLYIYIHFFVLKCYLFIIFRPLSNQG